MVRLQGVSKQFRPDLTWRALFGRPPRTPGDGVLALDEVTFDVSPGEAVGMIGPNGAGKTTLLKVLAGITEPDSGRVAVPSRVRSMIELGLGFHPDLTGIENVKCALIIHGHRRRSLPRALDAVVAFADIGAAVDRPLRTYSQGMAARLAFAVATYETCELLLVDEVLAVGDADFQLRCLDRMVELRQGGAALIFVSHDMPLVATACDRVVHLRGGRVVDDGPTTGVVERYLSRAPRTLTPSQTDLAEFIRLEATTPLRPWDRVELTIDVDVRDELRRTSLAVEVMLPILAPGVIVGRTRTELGGLRPGRHVLHGRSMPWPAGGVDVRVHVTLVDDVLHRLVTTGAADVHITGVSRAAVYTGLSVEPEWELSPVEGSTSVRPAKRVRQPPRPGAAIGVSGLSKCFAQPSAHPSLLPGRAGRGRPHGEPALRDIDLNVAFGEAVGLIGPNGAGKSTLLRVVAGLTAPTAGTVRVGGRVGASMGLGLGFRPDVSGRDNLMVLASIFGVPPRRLDGFLDAAIDLADAASYVDSPAREYSLGMASRLSFAASVLQPAEILLIDESLAVGDAAFREVAIEAVRARIDGGAAMIFVSHDLRLVEEVCGRCVWLSTGMIVDDGPVADVVGRYAGSSWAAGASDSSSGIAVTNLSVETRRLRPGSDLHFAGQLVVDLPHTDAHVEVSYRLCPASRSEPLSYSDRQARTIFRSTVEPPHGVLGRRGRYRFEGCIPRNHFGGRCDFVVSVVDDLDSEVLAEAFAEIEVGETPEHGFPGPIVEFDWTFGD